jgi:hypothetical protein
VIKHLALLMVLFLCAAISATAQTDTSRRLDNFDFASGVHIQEPPAPVATRRSRQNKKVAANGEPGSSETAVVKPLTRLTSMPVGKALDGFSTGDAAIDNFIVESGNRNGVDPLLLYAIMHQESTFKERAVSPKGARGLMQLMPGTAARYGVTNIFDPRQNIEGGARYMRFLMDLFSGDVQLALAGYNAGENAVIKFGSRVPPYSETIEYVRRIGRRYALMRDPLTAGMAARVTSEQAKAMRSKEPLALSIYERNVFAVRLPDGRLQLVSQ